MTSGTRYATQHTHPAMWCAECDRVHTGDDDDARGILGDRGTWSRTAYVWSARCGEYHLSTYTVADAYADDTVGRAMRTRPNDVKRARDIAQFVARTRQPKRSVRTSSVWTIRTRNDDIANAARRSRVAALARGGIGI